MAFGSEISAKLGVDTASVAGDLAKAKQAFTTFGQQVESAGAGHGAAAGDKLVGALEHKIGGARHLAGALSAALGLNIEHIAHGITSAIVGGTKEAWEEMGKLAEQNAKLIEEKMRIAMTPKQAQAIDKRKLKDATEDFETAKRNQGSGFWENMLAKHSESPKASRAILSFFGLVQSEAARVNELQEKGNKIIEAELPLDREKAKIKESHKKLAEFEAEMQLKNLTGGELIAGLEERRNEIQEEIKSGKLDELEIDERKKHFDELGVQIAGEKNKLIQAAIDKEKELLRLRKDLAEAQRKLAKDEEDLANKRTDRGKGTIGEIADLKARATGTQFGQDTHVDTFGLSAEAAAAKEQAAEILRMQKQAEGLRLSGDVGGANALFDQIGAKKQTLVDSGFAKSSEGDEFKKMAETLHQDNQTLAKALERIENVAKGKLRNE